MSFTRVTLSWCLGEDLDGFYLLDANGKPEQCPAMEHDHKLTPRKSWLCNEPDCSMAYIQDEPPTEHEHAVW